ncbi:hypothetical protein Tco_1316525, partial [Tanacetum coccineum]
LSNLGGYPNRNGPCVQSRTDTSGQLKILPPKTAEEIVARERERKARTTLLMAIPEDHLAKFHKMTDAKEMWNAIKSRFGGNDESKKIAECVSTEDANQKFLRSLPSAWLQVSLIMRNKPGMDSLSFDDLYNNLRVFENDVKGSTASSSNLQNVAFVSENTSSTNDVSTAYGVSNTSDQVDEYDLEEMDLKWQVAMISMRIKKFYKKTGRKLQFDAKEPVGFDKTKVECNQQPTKNEGICKRVCLKPVVNESNIEVQPKVWSDAPIIEEYESDSDDEQTVLTSTALKVNTVKPIVNGVRPANVFHKTHSPSSRPFKRTTVLRTNFSNQKVYTAKDNPHRTLKNKGIIDSGCSRHMTGNKAYLADFQET